LDETLQVDTGMPIEQSSPQNAWNVEKQSLDGQYKRDPLVITNLSIPPVVNFLWDLFLKEGAQWFEGK
jgi:hypothetical protein